LRLSTVIERIYDDDDDDDVHNSIAETLAGEFATVPIFE